MKKTLLASAVFMALAASGTQCQAGADVIYQWDSSSVPEITENTFAYDGSQDGNSKWGLGVTDGATGTLKNLDLTILQQANGSAAGRTLTH